MKKKALKYYVRPERGQEDIIGPTFGPFDEFIQLTYGDVRVGPNGESIGTYANGLYFFGKTFRPKNKETPIPVSMKNAHNCQKNWTGTGFSDVVIWAE